MQDNIPDGFSYDPVLRMHVCDDDAWARQHAAANSFGSFNHFVEVKRAEYVTAQMADIQHRSQYGRSLDAEDVRTLHMLDAMV